MEHSTLFPREVTFCITYKLVFKNMPPEPPKNSALRAAYVSILAVCSKTYWEPWEGMAPDPP